MSATNSNRLTVERKTFTERQTVAGVTKDYAYKAWAITGWLNGKRVRKQAPTQGEALTEKERLEIDAANIEGAIRPVNTRLNEAQLAQAEAAFARLAGKPLPQVVEWYLATYRPPTVEKLLTEAVAPFLEAKATEVRPPMWNDYRKTLRALERAMPGRNVHTITTPDLEALMKTLGPSKKSQNNQRGNLNAFFEFCLSKQRRWATENPVTDIRRT